MKELPTYFRYWGKTEKDGAGWHPVVCHMLDTGIVAREILAIQPDDFRQRFTSLLRMEETDALNALTFITALHDIGKISPGFQSKRVDLCGSLIENGFPFQAGSELSHPCVNLDVVYDILTEEFGCNEEAADTVARVLAAHHGAFLTRSDRGKGTGPWIEARKEVAVFLAEQFGVQSLESLHVKELPDLLLLAGLISVADWIASADENFGYTNGQPSDLPTYLNDRTLKARSLIQGLNMGTVIEEERPFSVLFDFKEPNACQSAVLEVVKKLRHPMLVIVETPTGSGKTEAAQAGYATIAARHGLRGMYCALPTQATGNAMFDRMETFLRKLHPAEAVELHLLHANADINPRYKQLKIASIEDNKQTVVASSWFTARKRGLLAAYGAGTVDQALLAVLKVRHFFVRLFGLAGKIIVMDEVHAYDTYMSEEINSLIGWASRCGSSVFLLSATLPIARRKRLIQAFSPDASVPDDLKYPCVFGIDFEGGTACKAVEMQEALLELAPEVVGTSNKIERMAGLITEMIENGGCAACILNTVSEAQELYEKLKDCLSDTDLILFHSRFTLERRLTIEKAITGEYGIKRDKRPPRGVVIATQVIEQSLDLDFDYMVTDLAPIDLLLQRAGRLHRHVVRKFSRVLHVMIPDLLAGSADFGPSRFVYFPDILHRTGRLFIDMDAYRTVRVEIPTGVSPLVEAVYGETDEMQNHDIQFEEMLSKWIEDRLGKQQAETFLARLVTLPSVHTHGNEPGYLADLPNDRDEDAVLSTRIARPSITLLVLKEGEDISVHDDHAARKLYHKSLNSDNPKIFRHFSKEEPPKEWEQSPLLRNCRPLFLHNGSAEYGGVELYYDNDTGLKIKRTGGTR